MRIPVSIFRGYGLARGSRRRCDRATAHLAAPGAQLSDAEDGEHYSRPRPAAEFWASRRSPMHLARFPRARMFPAPTPLEKLDEPVPPTGRAGDLDQARRLHRGGERRQQGAQAGVAGRRGAGPGRGPPGDAGGGAVQPRAADRRGGAPVWHEMHRAAGASGGDQRPRLPEQRQRAAGQAVRLRDRVRAVRAGHERRGGGEGRGAARRGGEAIRDPGRRVEPGGRAGLRLLRAGTGAAGGRDGAADRPRWSPRPAVPGRMPGWWSGCRAATRGCRCWGSACAIRRTGRRRWCTRLAEATADYVGVRGGIPRAAVEANCDYIGAGYGQPTQAWARRS